MRKKFWITIGLALLILAGLAGGWFYYFQIYHVNYLIKGVPYNGIYNLFFERADSTLISSMMDILGYWGDKRITLSQLLEKFPPPDITRKPAPPASIQDVKKFFEENGYETYYWTSTDSGKEIKEIKKFVNSVKKIPVVVYQKRSFDEESSAKAFRVVIGIFDRDKKVIVHDHNFGNNYEISYQDFEKMFRNDARVILAVWPSDKIKGQIAGPNYNAPYPSRLEAMDRVGNILAAEKAEA